MLIFRNLKLFLSKLPAELLLLIPLLGLMILPTSCGSSSGSDVNTLLKPGAVLQLNVGDDPCDRVASLVLDFTSVNLKDDKGNKVGAMNGSSSIEFMHLLGTMQSVSLSAVPQGNYTGAELSIASANISYVSPVSGDLTSQTVNGPWTVSFPISPAMVVTTEAVALNLHLAVGDSISFDESGNIVFNPKFTPDVFQGGSTMGHGHRYGGLDHATGRVTLASDSSFTMNMMQSVKDISVKVGSGTKFEGVAGVFELENGMIVTVDADMESSGSLTAQTVHVDQSKTGGMAASGVVTSITGSPATELSLIGQDGSGSGVSSHDMGGMITGSINSSAQFTMDSGNVDLSGLPFTPEFGSTTIYKGQAVEIVSGNGMMHDSTGANGSADVLEVRLEKQGLRGTVSNHSASGNQATFNLDIASESFFTRITGQTTIMVFQRPDTEIWGSGTITDGASVIVHGLLFGGSDSYKLVATRIVVH